LGGLYRAPRPARSEPRAGPPINRGKTLNDSNPCGLRPRPKSKSRGKFRLKTEFRICGKIRGGLVRACGPPKTSKPAEHLSSTPATVSRPGPGPEHCLTKATHRWFSQGAGKLPSPAGSRVPLAWRKHIKRGPPPVKYPNPLRPRKAFMGPGLPPRVTKRGFGRFPVLGITRPERQAPWLKAAGAPHLPVPEAPRNRKTCFT